MRVLILTNPEHHKFVYETKEHHALSGNSMYLYDRKFNFDLGLDYDIGISFMYQHKVPAKEVNSHPWFNFHPAPLPEYKGRNLCYWAITNGESKFGATIHYMDENFDTGDIIEVLDFAIPEWATAEDLSEFAINASKQLFQMYFPRVLAGEEFERHPNTGGAYYLKNMPIGDTLVCLDREAPFNINRFVRAVSYKNFHPKLIVGDVRYKIVKDE